VNHALDVLKTLGQLLGFVIRAIRDGKPERVDRILPHDLHTTLARRLADAEAEERFARRDDETRPVIRDAGNGE
jgi:hypothetical protein